MVPDSPEEKFNVERLFQERSDSILGGALMLVRQGRDDNNRHGGMGAFHQQKCVPAIAVWHIEIEQDQVRLMGYELGRGFPARRSKNDVVLLQHQYLSEHFADRCVIICQQDCFHKAFCS